MTLVVFLSYCVPFLKGLASHGKTRIPDSSGSNQSTPSAIKSFFNSQIFLIEKRRFSQFYYIGILWLTASVMLSNKTGVFVRPSIIILYMHLFRRLYECLYVHKWRPSSRMHIAGYAVGLIHYLWLPSVFIRLPCRDCLPLIFGSSIAKDLLKFYDETAKDGTSRWPPIWLRMPAIVFCLLAQWQQHRHHVYLAELRRVSANNKSANDKSHYSLPTKGWFRVVTCPHYLAEIAIYAGFAIILAQEQKHGPKHWIVFVWVASNLTLSAIINHRWYKANLPRSVIDGKFAIFPHIL